MDTCSGACLEIFPDSCGDWGMISGTGECSNRSAMCCEAPPDPGPQCSDGPPDALCGTFCPDGYQVVDGHVTCDCCCPEGEELCCGFGDICTCVPEGANC